MAHTSGRELAREWVTDLRSGKFPQIRRALHDGTGYCPLGVLSVRIAAHPAVIATGWLFDGRNWQCAGKRPESGSPPWDVWAAIGFSGGLVPSTGYIAHRNDKYGDTFGTIAGYIEAALAGQIMAEDPIEERAS